VPEKSLDAKELVRSDSFTVKGKSYELIIQGSRNNKIPKFKGYKYGIKAKPFQHNSQPVTLCVTAAK